MSASDSILFISRQLAVPRHHGGCVYPHAILRALRNHGLSVDYAWLARPLDGRRHPVMRDPLAGAGWRNTAVPHTISAGSLRLLWPPHHWLRAWTEPRDTEVERAPDEHEQRWFAHLVAELRPTRLIVDFAINLPVLDKVPADLRGRMQVAVLTHNNVAHRTKLYRHHQRAFDFIPLSADEERRLLCRADIVVAIQDREAAEFRTMLHGPTVVTVPPPMIPEPLSPSGDGLVALFVGGYSGHNLAALDWLLRDIWPLVLAAIPAARLHVAGTVARAVPKGASGVVPVGPHPDLRETYAAASLVLAPLPLGTGLKLKVVEGMAAGRAVVTTPAGAEGFDELENGSTAVVADSAQTFADSVVRLLRDPASRRQIAARQLDWISRRLNPEAALAPLFAAGF